MGIPVFSTLIEQLGKKAVLTQQMKKHFLAGAAIIFQIGGIVLLAWALEGDDDSSLALFIFQGLVLLLFIASFYLVDNPPKQKRLEFRRELMLLFSMFFLVLSIAALVSDPSNFLDPLVLFSLTVACAYVFFISTEERDTVVFHDDVVLIYEEEHEKKPLELISILKIKAEITGIMLMTILLVGFMYIHTRLENSELATIELFFLFLLMGMSLPTLSTLSETLGKKTLFSKKEKDDIFALFFNIMHFGMLFIFMWGIQNPDHLVFLATLLTLVHLLWAVLFCLEMVSLKQTQAEKQEEAENGVKTPPSRVTWLLTRVRKQMNEFDTQIKYAGALILDGVFLFILLLIGLIEIFSISEEHVDQGVAVLAVLGLIALLISAWKKCWPS